MFQHRVNELEYVHLTKAEQELLHVLRQIETNQTTDEAAYHGVS
jgi:hypothetical protein